MRYLIYCALALTMFTAFSACQDKRKAKNYNQETNVGQDGLNFINTALEGGTTEVKAANVALTNAASARVKAFAQMMITDHTKAGNELKDIADDKLVTTTDGISPEHQKMINGLSAKKGTAFDKAYMQMMVADHKSAVELFERATHLNTSKVKNFAEQTLPILRQHLDSANAINAALR